MRIVTKFFGEQEIDEQEIISFEHGIPGFEDNKRYIIQKYNDSSIFFVLQSVETAEVALIIIDLERVMTSYSIDLDNEITTELKLAQPEDAAVVAVVTIPGEVAKATVNLAAPIVINLREKIGKQIIIDHPAYNLRQPLFDMESVAEAQSR
jgi:flagellar assembly factor FliW